jgi:hypothetical protein
MQTFLPYPDFQTSAKILDNKRLGKQRVEAKQILEILLIKKEQEWWSCPSCGKIFYTEPERECPKCDYYEGHLCFLWNSVESGDKLPKIPWENHPAVRMWRGYEECLALYGWIMCREWRQRGFVDNLQKFFESNFPIDTLWGLPSPHIDTKYYPKWYKDCTQRYKMNYSHQANLLRKDFKFYYPRFTPDFTMLNSYKTISYEWNREYWGK